MDIAPGSLSAKALTAASRQSAQRSPYGAYARHKEADSQNLDHIAHRHTHDTSRHKRRMAIICSCFVLFKKNTTIGGGADELKAMLLFGL
ncbi:MAG: hypothetical protein ACK5JM_12935 [Rhodoblastus sp.]